MDFDAQMERLVTIVQLLKKNTNGLTYKEIEPVLLKKARERKRPDSKKIGVSKETFYKDRKLIEEFYGYEISATSGRGIYKIKELDINPYGNDMFDLSQDYLYKTKLTKHGKIVRLEKKVTDGAELIPSVLHAIIKRFLIKVEYNNYHFEKPLNHTVAPVFIKEFKGRTYIVGKELETDKNIWLSLDRVIEFDVLKEKFNDYPLPPKYLDDCFGIVDYDDYPAQETLIKVTKLKAKYFTSYPLHSSQDPVEETEEYTIFSYTVKPTYDFIIELLSHSHQLEVLKPEYLKNEVIRRLKETLQLYNIECEDCE